MVRKLRCNQHHIKSCSSEYITGPVSYRWWICCVGPGHRQFQSAFKARLLTLMGPSFAVSSTQNGEWIQTVVPPSTNTGAFSVSDIDTLQLVLSAAHDSSLFACALSFSAILDFITGKYTRMWILNPPKPSNFTCNKLWLRPKAAIMCIVWFLQ
jgi:hypothetical protein